MKVLVADDDPTTRKIVTKALEPYASVTEAQDGELALQHFQGALGSREPFNFIVLDISMPKVDGLDVLAAIRVLEEQRGVFGDAGVKTLILTGSNDMENLYDAHTLDCCSYLSKPVDPSKLIHETKRLGLIVDEDAIN